MAIRTVAKARKDNLLLLAIRLFLSTIAAACDFHDASRSAIYLMRGLPSPAVGKTAFVACMPDEPFPSGPEEKAGPACRPDRASARLTGVPPEVLLMPRERTPAMGCAPYPSAERTEAMRILPRP